MIAYGPELTMTEVYVLMGMMIAYLTLLENLGIVYKMKFVNVLFKVQFSLKPET